MDAPASPARSLSPRGVAIAGWSAFLVAAWIFAAIAANISGEAPLVAVDRAVADWLHARGTPAATAFLLVVTHLHGTIGILAWSAVFAAVLARRREHYWLGSLAFAVVGGLLLNAGLKLVFERARPKFDDPWITLDSFSFPSGHTAGSVLFYGVLVAYLVTRVRAPGRRVAFVLGGAAAVALVAFSRVYLGAHYLSDVLAAACSSTAWLALCLSTGHALARRRRAARTRGA